MADFEGNVTLLLRILRGFLSPVDRPGLDLDWRRRRVYNLEGGFNRTYLMA
jgi:hypothetical protein